MPRVDCESWITQNPTILQHFYLAVFARRNTEGSFTLFRPKITVTYFFHLFICKIFINHFSKRLFMVLVTDVLCIDYLETDSDFFKFLNKIFSGTKSKWCIKTWQIPLPVVENAFYFFSFDFTNVWITITLNIYCKLCKPISVYLVSSWANLKNLRVCFQL